MIAVGEKFYVNAAAAGDRFEKLSQLGKLKIIDTYGKPKLWTHRRRAQARLNNLSRTWHSFWSQAFEEHFVTVVMSAGIFERRPKFLFLGGRYLIIRAEAHRDIVAAKLYVECLRHFHLRKGNSLKY